MGWALRGPGLATEKDDVELMLSLPIAHEPFDKIQFTGSFYFPLDDVHALREPLQDKTAIVDPLEDFDYDRLGFAIRDNNGYSRQFGQEL